VCEKIKEYARPYRTPLRRELRISQCCEEKIKLSKMEYVVSEIGCPKCMAKMQRLTND
jgi:hypothetical protein